MTPNQTLRANSDAHELNSLAAQEEANKHLMAARMRVRKGEREEAYTEIKRAFAAHPGDRNAIEMLGDLYLEDGETEKALTLYQRALKAHPSYAPFEEKIAICRLDLAEIEADRAAKNSGDPLALLQAQAEMNQVYERVPHKAVSLSLFLPGAGQFYNDEIEKGTMFLGGALVSFIGWFLPDVDAGFQTSDIAKVRFRNGDWRVARRLERFVLAGFANVDRRLRRQHDRRRKNGGGVQRKSAQSVGIVNWV